MVAIETWKDLAGKYSDERLYSQLAAYKLKGDYDEAL